MNRRGTRECDAWPSLAAVRDTVAGCEARQKPLPARHRPPPIRSADDAQNVRLVGYNDLQGREALVVTTKSDPANGNWVYVGHHESYPDDKPMMNPITGKMEFNGTSILEDHRSVEAEAGLAHPQRAQPEFARRIGGLRLQVRRLGAATT